MPPLIIDGMHGLGDCLHQRGVLRQLMAKNDVWLVSSWVSIYHDLIAQGLKVVNKRTPLRTQTKNALREGNLFSRATPPRGARTLPVSYRPADVRQCGSVLGAMCKATGCDVAAADFRLPMPAEWRAKAQLWIDEWRPSRPLMIYRPLVERREWGGCPARNPDHAAYAALFDRLRDKFFVVSIADLAPGAEWMVGLGCEADVRLHAGELDIETLAALIGMAGLVFTSPGFAVVLAQAVGTPVACIFGGYESSSSFSAGARFAPYLGIDPLHPCQCFAHNHACGKAIDLPRAHARLKDFVDEFAARSTVATSAA